MKNYSLDVSIILVNYNTTDLLVQAINSIFEKSTGFSYEVIVIDNDSVDNPYDVLNKKFGEKVIFKRLPENIGFGRANNEGIKISKGRNIFLLNTDTYLINNAIYILLNYIDNHPKVGSCGGSLLTADLEPTYSYHKVPYGILSYELSQLSLGLSTKFIKNPYYNISGKCISVGNVSGANMMLRREVLDQVGLFDPIFFMYCEESELSWRIRKAGYLNINVPEAKIVHLEGKSSQIKEKKQLMEFDGRKKYYIKTRGRLYFQLANVLLFLAVNLRLLCYWLLGRTSDIKKYKEIRRIFIKAYWR